MVDCDESSEIDILPCCLGSECVSVANARVCPSGPRTSRVEIADLMEVEQQGQKAYFFVEVYPPPALLQSVRNSTVESNFVLTSVYACHANHHTQLYVHGKRINQTCV